MNMLRPPVRAFRGMRTIIHSLVLVALTFGACSKPRRLAPEGTVYNVVRLSVRVQNGLVGIEPGTELKVISRNSNGTLHVQTGNLITDVVQSAVTNDLNVAAAVRSQ